MTKKEENQVSGNFSFKIKLIKKELPKTPKVLGAGLYQQRKNNDNTAVAYNREEFSIDSFKDVFGDLFNKTTKTNNRQVKIITNQAGMKEFEKALKEEALKTIKKDEHRKKLDFRSKIFKQTYKFR